MSSILLTPTSTYRSIRYWLQSLSVVVALGVAITATLVAVAFSFVFLYWFQTHGLATGTYTLFLNTGADIDTMVGTNMFQHPVFWHAFTSAIFAGCAIPLVGTYLVHREQALLAETLAHTAFAGIAAGVLVVGATGSSVPLELFALVVAVCGAIGVEWLRTQTNGYGDVPLAIGLVGSFAVGTLLITYGHDRMPISINIEGYLFGSVTIVTADGARLLALITVVVFLTIAFLYKQLLYVTFDTPGARAAQLAVSQYNLVLMILAAIVVVGGMQLLGVILVAGLLVIPAATATMLATTFKQLIVYAVLLGQFAVITGVLTAQQLGIPSGATIVSIAIATYIAVIGISN